MPSQVWAQPVQQTSGPDFGTYSIGEVQVPLTAIFGDGTYVWEVVAGSGSLPPGVSLRTDGADWFPTSASAGLIGVATTAGTYTFTLRVTSAGLIDDRLCTIKISPLMVKDLFSLADAFVNSPFSYTFTALNSTGPVTWSMPSWSNPLPPGVSLSSTGVLEGTATASGFYSISISASDAPDNVVFRSVNLAVFDIQITTPGALPNATQGGAYFATLNATGGSGSYTFTSDNLPNGLVLNPAGTISGTVNAGPGLFGFNLTATDTNQKSYAKRMSIDIVGVPVVLPSLSLGNTDDCSLGVPCNRNVSVLSGGTAPFTWTATGLPPGMSIRSGSGVTSSWITPGYAELWGTPTAVGTYDVEFTVTDFDGETATNTFPLVVTPLLRRNVASGGGTINVPYLRTIRVIGGTLPYSATQIGWRLPAGLSFDAVTFVVSGTPLENGDFNPLFRFTDSAGNSLRTFHFISIGGGASTIRINHDGDLGTVTLGSNYSNQFFACCAPSYAWSLGLGSSLPPGLSLSAGGLLSGTPSALGTYTFFVQAADATNSANVGVRQFTMIVTPLSMTMSTSLPYGNVGSTYSQTPTVTGGTGALTWTLAPFNFLPPGLTLASNGTLSGTPSASGQFEFTLTVTDSAGFVLTRTFRVSIYPAGVNPPLNLPPIGPFEAARLGVRVFQLAATGGQPPYHYSATPGATLIPGMRVQDGPPLPRNFPATITGGFIGVIAAPGTYTTSVRVTDSQSPPQTFDRSITLTDSAMNILSQFSLPKGAVGTPYSFTLTPYGGSGSYAWSATNLPDGLNIDASGQISGTPTIAGTYSPRIRLTDLADSSFINVSLSLVVNPFLITTGGVLAQGTVGTSYSSTLTAPGCGSGCTWTLTSGGQPGGFSLSSGGVLSGMPNSTFNSFFTVQASGSNGTVQKVLSLRIVSNTPQPLFINNTSFSDTGIGGSPANALFAQGGTLPHMWSLESGTLPPGLSLQGPGETLGANPGPGFFYLTGGAMQVGLYSFTLAVTDAVGTTVTKVFSWRITPFNFQYTSLPLTGTSLVFGTSYTQALLVLGGTGNYTWASTAMPPGLALDPNTGVVSGTPANTGTFFPPIQVADGAGDTMTQTLTFNISSPTSTLVNFGTGPSLGNRQQGFLQTINLSPSGGTPPFTITALTALPPGFALQSGDALLSGASGSYLLAGVPLATGNFTFTLQAQDSVGNIGVRTFTMSVTPFTQFSSSTLGDGSVGVPYSQSIITWDATGPVSWSVSPGSALPPGLSLSSAGVISGTPTLAGNYSFVLNATDSSGFVGSLSQSMRVSNIMIEGAQILPHAIVGLPFSHTFTATGGGGSLVWSATGLPAGFTISPTGTVSGTATSGAGTFGLVVTVTDGVIPVTRRFTLFTRTPNPSQLGFPLISTVLADTTVGQSTSFTLNPFGGVPPYTWSVATGSTLPPGLSLMSGSLFPASFPPTATLLAGAPTTPGIYTFDLIATDSVGAQMRLTFSLNVSSINILSGNPRNATMGTVYAQRFTPVGGTPPYTFSMSPTSLTQEMLPPGLSLSSDGLIAGTPASTGNYSFFLRAQDSAGNTFRRSYSLQVNNTFGLRVTSVNPADAFVGSGRRFQTLSTSGSSTYTWSVVSGTLPAGMALVAGTTPNTTLLAGQPTAPGTYTYTLRATDNANALNSADHVFTIRVSPLQVVSPPFGLFGFLDLPGGQLGVPYSTAFKVAGGTPPYFFEESPFAPLPAGLTLSSDGVLSGTPQVIGVFPVTAIISDSAGHTVNGPNTTLFVAAGAAAPLSSVGTGILDASRGVPYSLPLNPSSNALLLIRGGVPPYAWAIASGSSLPPGMAVLTGGNGVPDHLGGIPSTAGSYTFALTVTDGSGQTLTVPLTGKVAALALTPDTVPPGVVGTPYSVSLVPSGGASPYSIQLGSTFDMPPGLTLSSGLLSGTPTYPGNFLIQVIVTDSAGNSLAKFYGVTIDNATGQAPALSLAPKPIQVYYEQTSPVPGPVSVSVNTTSGSYPFSLAVSGIPGATLSASNGTVPATVGLNLNVGSLAAGTYVGVLGASAPESANLFDSVPVTVTVAPPPPCSYTVNPSAGSVPNTGGVGSFGVSTGGLCSWTATPSDSWIVITSSGSGTGSGSVSYLASPNAGPNQRNGSITVNGQVYTLTQFGSSCSFAINPVSLSAPATGGTATIAVTASDGSCTWSASGLDATPTGGTGNGSVMVTVPPNFNPFSQTLNATIADQILTVNQAGVGCSVGLSPYDASSPAAGGPGSVTVTTPAGCPYDTVLGPSWITVTSGGAGVGSGTLVYSVDANSTTEPRSGTLTIGGQPFEITQDGIPCSVTVDTSGLGSPYGPSGGTGTILITANGANCAWTAASGAAWASVLPPFGTGNGTIGVSATSNAASADPRSADLTIAGQTVTLSQAGTTCTYNLQSSTGSVPASGGSGSVGVVAPGVCSWTSVSNDPSWLTISSSGSGGTAEVQFVAQANPDASPRTGTLTIAGLTYSVTQAGAPCSYTLGSPGTPTAVAAGGATDSFSFSTTFTGCSPSAVSYASWISGSTSFGGSSGSVTYTVAANVSAVTRSGTIQLGDQTFTILQLGGPCGFSLNAYGRVFGQAGGADSVLGSPSALGCTPVTGTDQPSFVFLGALSPPASNIFTQPYSVAPFSSLTVAIRRARITFGGQIFTIKQTSW